MYKNTTVFLNEDGTYCRACYAKIAGLAYFQQLSIDINSGMTFA